MSSRKHILKVCLPGAVLALAASSALAQGMGIGSGPARFQDPWSGEAQAPKGSPAGGAVPHPADPWAGGAGPEAPAEAGMGGPPAGQGFGGPPMGQFPGGFGGGPGGQGPAGYGGPPSGQAPGGFGMGPGGGPGFGTMPFGAAGPGGQPGPQGMPGMPGGPGAGMGSGSMQPPMGAGGPMGGPGAMPGSMGGPGGSGMMGGPGMMGVPGMMGGPMMGGPETMEPDFMSLMRQVALSDEQRSELGNIADELRRQRWDLMGQMMDHESEIRRLQEEQVRHNQAIMDLRGKIREAGGAAMQRAQQLLTEEQKARLQEVQRQPAMPGGMWPRGGY